MQPASDKQKQALARLKELHSQSIPFIEARDILLKEGFTPMELINGAYLFNRPDPNEDPTLEQQNLNAYLSAHPETANQLIYTFDKAEEEHDNTEKRAQTIENFGNTVHAFIDAGLVL